MEEREYKWLLTQTAYEEIGRLLAGADPALVMRAVQVNHYYDTADWRFNRSGVTVRVRQKNGYLKGTIKRHVRGTADGLSLERPFAVAGLPGRITLDGHRLLLQGQLVTERQSVPLAPGIRLCLDRNHYLGVTDHELELEYADGYNTAIDQWKAKVSRYMHEQGRQAPTQGVGHRSKSARFFAAKAAQQQDMTILEGSEAYGYLISGNDPDDTRYAGSDLQPYK